MTRLTLPRSTLKSDHRDLAATAGLAGCMLMLEAAVYTHSTMWQFFIASVSKPLGQAGYLPSHLAQLVPCCVGVRYLLSKKVEFRQ